MKQSKNSPDFDAITDLAAKILDFPIACISLVCENEHWFKVNCGLDADQTHRDLAFCSYTIKRNAPLIVNDARLDLRFRDNPLVLGPPKIVFYAGIPVSIDGVHNLGTLCVIDTQPRQFDAEKLDQLHCFGRVVEGLILAFQSQKQAEYAKEKEARKCRELTRTNLLLEQIKELSGVGGWEFVLDPPALTWTMETKRIHEVALDFEPQIEKAVEFYAPKARPIISAAVEHAISAGIGWDLELPMVTAKGKDIWVRAIGNPKFKDGSVISLVGAFQDITRRKEIETRLQESEKGALETSAELSTILRSMGEGVSVFDKDYKLTIWNQKYIEIFAKPDGEIWKGVELRTLLEREKERGDFPGDIDAHLCNLCDQLSQGAPVVFQFRTQKGRVILSTHSQLPDGGFVGTHSDVTIQVQAVERAEYASRHDFLTGLPNRLAFNARIKELEKKDGGENRSLVLILVDLDKFKEINDTYGHQAGDKLLKDVAERLRNCVRKCDLVARLGGDEFAIVLECNADDALRISEAIAYDISHDMKRPFELSGSKVTASASTGLCIASAKSFDIDMVFNRADYALYRVKKGNLGSYQYHE
jgi:diguanylate cyclase (GGDEF)-like protein